MSYCSSCGKNIEKGDFFCQNCGSRINNFSNNESSNQKSLILNSNSNQTGSSNNRPIFLAILVITTIIIGIFVVLVSIPPLGMSLLRL